MMYNKKHNLVSLSMTGPTGDFVVLTSDTVQIRGTTGRQVMMFSDLGGTTGFTFHDGSERPLGFLGQHKNQDIVKFETYSKKGKSIFTLP